MNVGNAIRDAREAAGMTQEGLADRIGVTRNYICMLERGTKACPIPTGMDIARALGIPFAALYEETGGGDNDDASRTDR